MICSDYSRSIYIIGIFKNIIHIHIQNMTFENVLYMLDTIVEKNKIVDSLTPETYVTNNLNSLPQGTIRLGIMFDNTYLQTLPIFVDKSEKPKNKYVWYTDLLVSYLKQIKIQGVNELYIITCNMTNTLFVTETKSIEQETGINIFYSLNKTGNDIFADWIMENRNTSLIGLFFTENIRSWKHVLTTTTYTTSTDILTLFNFISANSLSYNDGVYDLNKDITLVAYDTYSSYHIQLNNKEVFNGNDHTITLDFEYGSSGLFFIASSSMKTCIKNLTMDNADYGVTGGGIVNRDCSYFTIDNCVNLAPAEDYSHIGGICGDHCHHFVIKNCTNRGDFSQCEYSSGGICGGRCFEFTITKCENYGQFGEKNNNGNNCGGICGGHCVNATITYCKNHGDIYGSSTIDDSNWNGSGGIAGGYFGEDINYNNNDNSLVSNKLSTIRHCKNYGKLDGGVGGICGGSLGYVYRCVGTKTKSLVEIHKCKNYGIVSYDSAGIVGNFCGVKTLYYNNIRYEKHYTFNTGATITISDCYTENGPLMGYRTGSIRNDNEVNITIHGTKIIIKNSFTKDKVPLIGSIVSHTTSDIEYVHGKHKTNLIDHPQYVSSK